MEINKYLIITPRFRRSWENTPSGCDLKIISSLKDSKMASKAVALKLNIVLPDEIFKKPSFEATITVDKEKVNKPVINAAVLDNIVDTLNKQLGLDLTINLVEPKKK